MTVNLTQYIIINATAFPVSLITFAIIGNLEYCFQPGNTLKCIRIGLRIAILIDMNYSTLIIESSDHVDSHSVQCITLLSQFLYLHII